MPAWVRDAVRAGPVRLLDTVLDVARYFGWTVDHCLEMPAWRFWQVTDHVRRRRAEMAQATTKGAPPGAAALLEERRARVQSLQ